MAQMERMRRAELSATNVVAKGGSGESAASVTFRLMHEHSDGPVKGMEFVASPGQGYEVECFGAILKDAPDLALDLPSGEMVVTQSATTDAVLFRAVVAIGEKGGPVTLIAKGGALVPCLFFMRATAL
jgi:hypothetical protein